MTHDEKRMLPVWDDDVPYCDSRCPQHDGKRCRLTGFKPDRVCVPKVREVVVALKWAQEQGQ